MLINDCLWGETQWAKLHWGGQGRERKREGSRVDDGGGGVVGMAGIWSWGARITGVLGRLGSRNCGGGQILHCWGWVSGRNKEAYLKELSPADLGTNYWRTDEIQANNFIQSFLCTRKGYRCCGGIKEGHHISYSPFCILRPAASPPWTCCSTCAYLRGARCCFGNSLSGMLG